LLGLFTQPDVRPDELIDAAEEAKAVFVRLGDELGLARAWRLVAQAQYLARCGGACVDASEHALGHARRAGDHLEVKEIVEWLAVAIGLGPTPAQDALRRCEELSLRDTHDDPALEVTLLSIRAYLAATLGRVTESEQLFVRARRTVSDPGRLYRLPYFAIYTGLASLLMGDAAAAERDLRAGCEALQDVGEKTNYSSIAAILADALCGLGRYVEADEFTRRSEAAARANDVLANVHWRSARAKVLAGQGKLESALALAGEAVDFAYESDFLNAHGDALLSLAEVLELSGKADEAGRAVGAASALYERKGNVVALAKASALLRPPAEATD
jgi:tetratricopeptide (TPR) repeat protein